MRVDLIRGELRLILFALIATLTTAHAERMPDPIEFIAGITAFAELCAAKYPELGDVPSRLFHDGPPSDKPFILSIKASPAFEPALAKARVEVLQLPEAKVETECHSLAKASTHR